MSPPPLLLHVFPTFAPGGAQVRTVGLMGALGKRFRHAVVPLDGRREAAELVPAEVALEVLPPLPRAGTAAMLRRARALLRAVSPDAVCTYNWGSIESAMAARTLGLPLLHHEDGFLPDEARAFKRRRMWTRRLVLSGARAVLVPSRRLERIALELWKLPRPVVHWIPNGVRIPAETSSAERTAARRSLGLPEDAFVVGGVGHLRGEKNFVRLIDAFARLGDRGDRPLQRLLILGDGEERPRLEARAAREDVAGRVLLPGHLEDLGPAYRAMDVFAISSDTEQMPISLLEAMAAGLPVASTDVGDVRIMLPGSGGAYVVPLAEGAAGTAALGDALARLAESVELRAALGRENRERARERYAYEVMVEAHRRHWSAACGRDGGAA